MGAPDDEAKLYALLESIFEDQVVTLAERTALLETQADVAPASAHRVFRRFVEAKWGEAISDGKLTEAELLLLRRVIEELEISDDAVPLQLRMALRRSP